TSCRSPAPDRRLCCGPVALGYHRERSLDPRLLRHCLARLRPVARRTGVGAAQSRIRQPIPTWFVSDSFAADVPQWEEMTYALRLFLCGPRHYFAGIDREHAGASSSRGPPAHLRSELLYAFDVLPAAVYPRARVPASTANQVRHGWRLRQLFRAED